MEHQGSGWGESRVDGFGQTGGEPPKRRGSTQILKRLVIIFSWALLSSLAAMVIFGVLKRGVEFSPPKIALVTEMKGLTSKPEDVRVSVVDDGVGLGSVNVWIQQNGESKQMLSREMGRAKTFDEKIVLSVPQYALKPGSARILVQAVDDSIWRNKSVAVRDFLVDEQPPELAVVDVPAPFQEGDLALLVYRAADPNLQWSGVRIGKDEAYKGTPMSEIDPAIVSSDLFGIFFTLSEGEGPLVLEAVDSNGNKSQKTVRVSVSSRSSGVGVKESAAEFSIKELVQDLLSSGYDFGNIATRDEIAKLLPESREGDRRALVRISKVIVNVSRQADLKIVRKAAQEGALGARWWKESGRLGLFTPKLEFQDTLIFNDGVDDLSSARVDSRVMEPISSKPPVYSPYDGVVVLSQDIGTLGKSVLIDHGAGLSTFFYGLGRRDALPKASVSKGQKIGAVGTSGFNFTPRLRMQVLLHGRPIDPMIILDGRRFYEQVDLRLQSVRDKVRKSEKLG